MSSTGKKFKHLYIYFLRNDGNCKYIFMFSKIKPTRKTIMTLGCDICGSVLTPGWPGTRCLVQRTLVCDVELFDGTLHTVVLHAWMKGTG